MPRTTSALRAEFAATGVQGPSSRDPLADAVAQGLLCYLSHLPPAEDGYGPDLAGFAVLVRAGGSDGVETEVLPLPRMTGSAVVAWRERWDAAAHAGDREEAQAVLKEFGTAVMEPVMACAGWPGRLLLLPDGQLSRLPLHAASVRRRADGERRSLVHEAVISYAPTVGILSECRARAASLSSVTSHGLPDRYIGVAFWDSAIEEGVQGEFKAAAQHFVDRQTFAEDAATPEAVEQALVRTMSEDPAPAVVHIASHARVNHEEPLSSDFRLNPARPSDEGLLRLSDLLRIGLGEIRLAVLSACESGSPSADNANEFMSLASGFLRLGAAGVVSTIWPLADTVGLILIPRFFDEWSRLPSDPGAALTAAQVWFATTSPSDIEAWMSDVAGATLSADAVAELTECQLQHPLIWATCHLSGA